MLDILYFLTGGFVSGYNAIKENIRTVNNRKAAAKNGEHIYYDAQGRLRYDDMFVAYRDINGHRCLVSITDDCSYGQVIVDYYKGSSQEKFDNIIKKERNDELFTQIKAEQALTEDKPFGRLRDGSGYMYYEKDTGRKYNIVLGRSTVKNGYRYAMCKEYNDGEIVVFMDGSYMKWVIDDASFNEEKFWKEVFFSKRNFVKGECDYYGRKKERVIELYKNYKYDNESLKNYLKKVRTHESKHYKYNFDDPLYYYTEINTGRKYCIVYGGRIKGYVWNRTKGLFCEELVDEMYGYQRETLPKFYYTLNRFLNSCIVKIYEGRNEIYLYYYENMMWHPEDKYGKDDDKRVQDAKKIIKGKWGDIFIHDKCYDKNGIGSFLCNDINKMKINLINPNDVDDIDYYMVLKYLLNVKITEDMVTRMKDIKRAKLIKGWRAKNQYRLTFDEDEMRKTVDGIIDKEYGYVKSDK